MKELNRYNIKAWNMSVLLGLVFALVFSIPVASLAHQAPPPPPPDEEPPPPPPCQSFSMDVEITTEVIGKDDCGEDITETTMNVSIVCDDTGTPDSVSYRTGYESFRRSDLLVNGAFSIRMMRQYMSNSHYDSPVGYGWAFEHDVRLFEYPDGSVVVRTGCGVNYKFVSAGGAYQAEVGSMVLTKDASDNSFDLVYLDGRRNHFDTQGRLIEVWDSVGNRLEYTYSTEKKPLMGTSPYGVDPARPITVAYVYQLTQIRERLASGVLSGNSVDLTYDPVNGRLDSITSNDGRTVSYDFDDAGNGQTKGNLVQVNGLEGVVSSYKYEDVVDINAVPLVFRDHHNITEIKHTADSEPVKLTYDALSEDRVVTEIVGNRKYSFNWASFPLSTTVTETVTDDLGLNPVDAVRKYVFDDNKYLKEYIDALGNKRTSSNDSLGNVLQDDYYENTGTVAVPIQNIVRTINRTYSAAGKKLTENITLDNGETIAYTWTYDSARINSKESVSSAFPTKITKTEKIFNHDVNGNATTKKSERNYKDDGSYLETQYTYNANNDVLTITLPDNHVIVNEYGAAYAGRYVTKTYHEIAGVEVPDLAESYEYDNQGNRSKVTDARGNFTTTTYDDKNRRTTTTNAKGHLTTFVYDVNDNLTEIKRDRSAVADQLDKTKLTYDSNNRLIQIDRTDDAGFFVKRSSMRYDSAGNVIARGDANDIETTMTYDLENRLTRITDADGNYIKYTLNALGHRLTTEYYKTGDILVRTSNAVFDDLNRQEQIIGALNQTTTYTYDVQGNRITATDALGRPTTIYTYDTLSRLTSITDANAKDTAYEYDDRDQLRFVTDPVGLVTEYQYNELGQLTQLISPDTGVTEYTYDLVGNRATQTDARNITVTFEYDAVNRITKKIYPDASLNVTYTYDAGENGIGKLGTMQDKEGITSYGYDERGNLVSRNRFTNTKFYLTQYGYDINDRLTSVTYPSDRVVTYVRNNLGQVDSVTTTPSGGAEQTIASNLAYLPFGALEDMDWGNGLSLDQTFDADYRLTDQVLGAVYSRTYGYDAVNNIKTITDNIAATKNQIFNYDDLDRLNYAIGDYGELVYAYDDVGNRTNLTKDAGTPTIYNYNPAANNRLVDIDGAVIAYDANGNTQTKDTLTFSYDDNNRMTQVSDAGVATTYGFNGKGERVRKSGAATTLYHYDSSGNLLFESDSLGNALVEYIWLGNQRLAMVQGANLYYTHVDHLGTVQMLTDGSGGVAWAADYKPFGEVTVTMASVENNLRFPGQYYDVESGLHYNYFRGYDPTTGRYVESDPMGLDAGLNTYIYTLANPLTYMDIFGLSSKCKQCKDECELIYKKNEEHRDDLIIAANTKCSGSIKPGNCVTEALGTNLGLSYLNKGRQRRCKKGCDENECEDCP